MRFADRLVSFRLDLKGQRSRITRNQGHRAFGVRLKVQAVLGVSGHEREGLRRIGSVYEFGAERCTTSGNTFGSYFELEGALGLYGQGECSGYLKIFIDLTDRGDGYRAQACYGRGSCRRSHRDANQLRLPREERDRRNVLFTPLRRNTSNNDPVSIDDIGLISNRDRDFNLATRGYGSQGRTELERSRGLHETFTSTRPVT
jgi:hypothetical protein